MSTSRVLPLLVAGMADSYLDRGAFGGYSRRGKKVPIWFPGTPGRARRTAQRKAHKLARRANRTKPW